MKTVGILIFLLFHLNGQAQFTQNFTLEEKSVNLYTGQLFPENEIYKSMNITFDWILETKAELLNGISYSPTIEFNLNRPNGMNFQIQTGALPVIHGIKIDRTQPCAGFSFGYSF